MKMKRSLNMLSLLFVSVGSMIGSGWLFGPMYAAQLAGPAAIFAWLLGGGLVIVVALTFTELSTMLPVTGGIARFPQFSHGAFVSYMMTWIAWIAYVLLPPIEVQASLLYATNYLPWLAHKVHGKTQLTPAGIGVAALLLFVMSYLNVLGIRIVTRFNTFITWLKILIPTLTAITLIALGFHGSNFTAHGGLAPYGIKGILTALPLAGVIFSFFGFRLSIELAGEARNPQRTLPIALIGSIIICMLLYTLLQVAFIGAEFPQDIANGWANLNFKGDIGPFAGIALSLGLFWLVSLLYIDAFVSPFGSALMVVTTTARLDYAMSINGYVPKSLSKLNSKGVPFVAVLVNFVVGLVLLVPFPGWQQLASFIIAALVISHAIAPISLVALRKQIPHQKRPFRLPAATFMSLLAFIILNLILYWTGWETIWKMYAAGLAGLVVLGLLRVYQRDSQPPLNMKHATWLLPYFIGTLVFSYYGNFGGGQEVLPFGLDMLYIALFNSVIFYLGVKQRLPSTDTQQQIARERSIDTTSSISGQEPANQEIWSTA